MNREEARGQLVRYWTLVQQADKHPALSADRRTTVRAANQMLSAVNTVLRGLAPDLRLISASRTSEHLGARSRVERALAVLGRWEAMAALQEKAGEPVLPLSALDPVVSGPAAPLWATEKYRQAVNDAATSLNLYIQSRIGRHDISDKDLAAQAFSDKEPEEGKARLRCPGNQKSETVRSLQEGARAFSIGTFQAIRNPAHHMTGDWNPETAFHHLAALSQVAHWFRNWDVVRYQPPPPDYGAANAALLEYLKAQQAPSKTN